MNEQTEISSKPKLKNSWLYRSDTPLINTRSKIVFVICFGVVYAAGALFVLYHETGSFAAWPLILFSTLFICAAAFVLFCSRISFSNSIFILIILLGLISNITLAPTTAPDENRHLASAYRYSSALLGYGLSVDDEGGFFARAGDFNEDLFANFPTAENYQAILDNTHLIATDAEKAESVQHFTFLRKLPAYLPAIIVLSLFRLLGIGSVLTLLAARLAQLLAFAFLVRGAIRKAPTGKIIITAIALLPLTISQAASFSYDGILIGCSLLFASYAFDFVWGDSSSPIRMRDIIIAGLAFFIMAYIKYAYLPFWLLLLFTPKARFQSERIPQVLQKLLFLIIIGLLGLIGMKASGFESSLFPFHVVTSEYGLYYIQSYTFDWVLANPLATLQMFFKTVAAAWLEWILTMVGAAMGWLAYFPPHILSWICILALLFAGGTLCYGASADKDLKNGAAECTLPTIWQRVVLWIAIFICFLGIGVAMLCGSTEIGSETIGGIQGRYALPALAFVVMSFRYRIKPLEGRPNIALRIVPILLTLVTMAALTMCYIIIVTG